MGIVNHQAFFDNFALFTNAPNSVLKLRELILQLAIEGRLVDQDSSNEPASRLLEKVDVAREALQTGPGKKNLVLSSVNVEDVPFAIPSNWLWTRLGHLSQVIEYGTSEKASLDQKGVPVFRMNNIHSGTIISSNLKYVRAAIKDLPRLYLKTNDLLFNRTNSFELVGKTGIFKGESNKFTFASYLIRIRLFDSYVSPDYVNWAMNAVYFRTTQINPEVTQQCGQANFNGTKLANVLIPLPPLTEQKRIVAKIDELMGLCDELGKCEERKHKSRAVLNDSTLAPLNHAASLTPEGFKQASERLADNFATLYDAAEELGRLRSTIFQLAIQGKLVPQEPNDESAAVLLKKNARLIKEMEISECKSVSRISEHQIPFDIPSSWVWTRVGDIAVSIQIGPFGTLLHKSDYVKNGTPLVNPSHIKNERICASLNLTVDEKKRARLNNYIMRTGDIVMGRRGEMGRCAIVSEKENGWLCGTGSLFFRFTDEIFKPYLLRVLTSDYVKSCLLEGSVGSTMNNLNQRVLSNLLIPLAPLAEQKRIVAKVNQLMAFCDELDAKLRQAEADSEKLMNAAVQHVLRSITEAGHSNGSDRR